MSNFITKSIAKLFGTKSQRDLKDLLPYVDQINAEFARLKDLSNDELRDVSAQLRVHIADELQGIDQQIDGLRQQVATDLDMDVDHKQTIFTQVDQLEKERNKELERVLLAILPQAFAVVKETARRFSQNDELAVSLTEFDIEIARFRKNVRIEGDKAYWSNTWDAAGNTIK